MVQRKDSLSYVEFLRGKYNVENCGYIKKLFSNMTNEERQNIEDKEFMQLWKELWQSDNDCKSFSKEFKEYSDAKAKFEKLKEGFKIKDKNNETYFFDIKYLINNTSCNLGEPEWGFPKGRRNINEENVICAIREFKEETGINPSNIMLLSNCKPFEELFSGSNNVMYKHIYYLATCNKQAEKNQFNPKNKIQSREIKDMKWLSYEDAQKHILDQNMERKELFKRVNNTLIKKLF
jgi:ADP-ribose pyrophosphatase YjhB (NUDIX family)